VHHGISALTVSEPVYIVGDDDVDWSSFDGDGSEESPYLIEDLYLELNSSKSWFTGIYIYNSTYNVIIRNCFVKGMYEWVDNELLVRGAGIIIYNSFNIRIINNMFNLTQTAIAVDDSQDCTIKDNIVLGNSIENDHGYLVRGIRSSFSNSCSIDNNTITNCSTAIEAGGLRSCVISNNTVTSCEDAFYGTDMMRNIISHNNFSGNSPEPGDFGGVSINTSNYTLLSKNIIDQSGRIGIGFGDNHHSTISENKIIGSYSPTATGYGILIVDGCSNNTIEWNSFINNEVNAYCDDMDNKFDYNYYSDYLGTDSNNDLIGDTPYTITGTAGIQDLHPRISSDARPVIVDDSNLSDIILMMTAASVLVVITLAIMKSRKR
jgi:nitrous oxidase accessory protein